MFKTSFDIFMFKSERKIFSIISEESEKAVEFEERLRPEVILIKNKSLRAEIARSKR